MATEHASGVSSQLEKGPNGAWYFGVSLYVCFDMHDSRSLEGVQAAHGRKGTDISVLSAALETHVYLAFIPSVARFSRNFIHRSCK